jgi:hypothetical protein
MKFIQKYRGGRSANTSSANRKSENSRTYKLFFLFADLPQMWQFADHVFFAICGPNYFCDLKTPLIRKYINFPLTKISLKCFHSNLRTTFGFWNSFETIYMVFRSLNSTNVGKKMLEATQCGSGSETLFSRLQVFGLSSRWRKLTLLYLHSLGRPAKNTLSNT